jgi:hypothetical protein
MTTARIERAPGAGGATLAADIARGVIALACGARLEPGYQGEPGEVGEPGEPGEPCEAGPERTHPTSLAWPLVLNAHMHRHAASPADVVDALGALRAVVLEVAGLDPSTEPVPLPVADLAVQSVNNAVYLAGLIERASAHADTTPDVLVGWAVERLAGRLARIA